MTQNLAFSPAASQLIQLSVTLDGAPYTAIISWNLGGRRWYLNLYSVSTNGWLLTEALVPSSSDQPINLVGGYFTQSILYYDEPNSQLVAVP